MTNLIVAFPKLEDARSIRNILIKHGFSVAAVCTSGAQALQYADDLHSGIVICGYRLADMICTHLCDDLPEQFDMLLLASARYAEQIDRNKIQYVSMPLKIFELVNSVSHMVEEKERKKRKMRQQPKERNRMDKAVISEAKAVLMDKKGMTEEEAHRYLQKQSMDNGVNMLETAQLVLSILNK